MAGCRSIIGLRLGLDTRSVDAYILGEHGDSSGEHGGVCFAITTLRRKGALFG